jgi:hypothetical protein
VLPERGEDVSTNALFALKRPFKEEEIILWLILSFKRFILIVAIQAYSIFEISIQRKV